MLSKLNQRERKDFTLHVRLTRRCNADCDYCSSRSADDRRMTPEEYRQSLLFIRDLMQNSTVGAGKGWSLTIQYVGGEVLTIPQADLYEIVESGREIMAPLFDTVIDGVQSNLVATPDKITFLNTLFGHRIGTSIDPYTGQRKLNGSSSRYQQTVKVSLDTLLRRRNFVPPAIFVVDEKGLPFVEQVIRDAENAGQSLRLRPVFTGGSDVRHADIGALETSFGRAARQWLATGKTPVEPFREMAEARINSLAPLPNKYTHACPFSEDCAGHSFNLDANGDIYLCLDMADANQMRLGNALKGEFDISRFAEIYSRRSQLSPYCTNCKWVDACRGGCPSEGLSAEGHINGKTMLCKVWKAIYAEIDKAIEAKGVDNFRHWLEVM